MKTIAEVIEATMRKIEAGRPQTRLVTDEQVARKIEWLGQRGYRPSPQIVEPIRALLQGYALLLSGDAGVGKTFLMRCLGVRLYNAERIADYGLASIRNWYEWTDEHDLCIDDLGSERIVAEYGAKDDVLKSVLSHREAHQTDNHAPDRYPEPRVGLTHITTNLTADEIAGRYGDRTLSRILGMCKPFTLCGTSMRAPVAVPAAEQDWDCEDNADNEVRQ